MLFNSLSYLLFLPLVFALYWYWQKRGIRWQNAALLVSSYVFYACWDWRFLFLLLFSTALDYYTGLRIHESRIDHWRKIWFWTSVGINLGFLAFFKYFNFFIDSFADLVQLVGLTPHRTTLDIILPIGISFYTFHGLSYVIDIYKKRIEPERHPVDYALFVSYFPLLVAGPIERATHLLPQLKRPRVFYSTLAIDGIHQIIWGLFKKIVIADSCAIYANVIFEEADSVNSLTLCLGAIYFAFQIYGDFSGYSDIALGSSKLFGIQLLRNFNYPYFSRDIAEFWRRWHISLSSWFKDYLYIPLGGSKGGLMKKMRNTFIIFLVSGFWHGANWTFVLWGFINAVYLLPLLLAQSNRQHLDIVAHDRKWPTLREFWAMCSTFALASLAWIFFRSASITDAWNYLVDLFSFNFSGGIQLLSIDRYSVELMTLLAVFVVLDWISRRGEHPFFGRWKNARLIGVGLLLFLLGVYANASAFIYFQF